MGEHVAASHCDSWPMSAAHTGWCYCARITSRVPSCYDDDKAFAYELPDPSTQDLGLLAIRHAQGQEHHCRPHSMRGHPVQTFRHITSHSTVLGEPLFTSWSSVHLELEAAHIRVHGIHIEQA